MIIGLFFVSLTQQECKLQEDRGHWPEYGGDGKGAGEQVTQDNIEEIKSCQGCSRDPDYIGSFGN